MSSSTMVTARIPEALVEKLDEAARKLGRSRSWIVKEALERHLAQEPKSVTPRTNERRDIMSFAGAGIKLSNRRTDEEIDAEIRWLRGND
ncbi:ribbon-helix-helix domain-containing protein [Rhizobium sp. LjRoot254]|uniref:ribbon-helix-helix domain-containing protein n=1 Tax=Rhizobium sp. LjRoot254 TaxID=3342297 RepID=UPI003ECD088A